MHAADNDSHSASDDNSAMQSASGGEPAEGGSSQVSQSLSRLVISLICQGNWSTVYSSSFPLIYELYAI